MAWLCPGWALKLLFKRLLDDLSAEAPHMLDGKLAVAAVNWCITEYRGDDEVLPIAA